MNLTVGILFEALHSSRYKQLIKTIRCITYILYIIAGKNMDGPNSYRLYFFGFRPWFSFRKHRRFNAYYVVFGFYTGNYVENLTASYFHVWQFNPKSVNLSPVYTKFSVFPLTLPCNRPDKSPYTWARICYWRKCIFIYAVGVFGNRIIELPLIIRLL